MKISTFLKKQGYKYCIMKKRGRKTFYATKADPTNTNPIDFSDDADFDIYSLENKDTWDMKKGEFICLK